MSRITFCLAAGLVLTICAESLRSAPPDKATQRALGETMQVEFVDTPLAEAIEQLARRHKIPIAIDEEELGYSGIPTDEPVNLILKEITLQSALALICHDLGLMATPQNGGGLLITTSESAEEQLDTRSYDMRPISRLVARDPQRIIDVVHSCTDGQWVDIDGIGGTVQLKGTTLVVEQTNRVHNRIAELLARLERIVNPQRAPQLSQREKNEQALLRAVQREVKVEFIDTPMLDAIDELSRKGGVAIIVDEAALSDSGIPTDEPVNLPLQEKSLAETLDDILQPQDLGWLIDNEVIVVTTIEVAKDRRQLGLFDVRRQVRGPGDASKLVSRIQGGEGTGPWEQIDGIGGTAEVLGGVLVVFQHRQALENIAELLK